MYGEDVMLRMQIFEWHKHFEKDHEEVEDDPKMRQPSTTRSDENITRVNQLVWSDHRLTVQMISNQLSLNRESVQTILLYDLEMWKVRAKVVLKVLLKDQKQKPHQIFVKTCLRKLKTIWIFLGRSSQEMKLAFSNMIPEIKRQSMQWKTTELLRPKKAHMSKSKIKVMLIAFFDQKGMVHHEFCLRVKEWISTSTSRFSFTSITKFDAAGKNCGVTSHGFSTMTMHPRQLMLSSSWSKNNSSWPPSLFSRFSTLWLLSFFQPEGSDERNSFLVSRRNQGLSDEGAENTQKGFYQVLFDLVHYSYGEIKWLMYFQKGFQLKQKCIEKCIKCKSGLTSKRNTLKGTIHKLSKYVVLKFL